MNYGFRQKNVTYCFQSFQVDARLFPTADLLRVIYRMVYILTVRLPVVYEVSHAAGEEGVTRERGGDRRQRKGHRKDGIGMESHYLNCLPYFET